MKFHLPLLLAVSVAANAAVEPATPARGLLVISPNSLEGALQEFVGWKKTLLPTEWISLEEIMQSAPGVDDPEKLKRFLYEKWQKQDVGYVLLAGDVDVLPVRYMVLDRKTEAAFNYAFYPSDLYYADLAKPDGSFEDWNARKDGFHAGYIGEVRGEHHKEDPINYDQVDYQPELAVGRWPVSTSEEVKHIAEKSEAYERKVLAESEQSLRRAGFIAVDGWVDSRPLLQDLAKTLEGRWQISKRLYGSDSPPPDTKEVLGLLNEGSGLMVHTGHGTPERWEQCFSIADIDQLTNAASVPVFISAGCSTAHFAPLPPYEPYVDRDGKRHDGTDRGEKFTEPPLPPSPIQAGAVNPTCLGEQLLKKAGTGGVAYIGCNTGSQPFGLTLVDGFIRDLADSDAPRLGDCWNSAVRYYIAQQKVGELKPTESWVPASIFFQAMKFMMFGDPTLRLPGKAAAIPATANLRPALEQAGITPRQQGGRGTCSVFTVTAAMEYAFARLEKPAGRLSVEYINWASNQSVGQAADGGFFSDLWKGYRDWGICQETEMPYSADFDPGRKPDPAAIASAKPQAARLRMNWIKLWNVKTGLTDEEFAAIQQTLAKGSPVCSGLRWPEKESWRNGVLEMRPPDAVFDGHSVLVTGYEKDSSQPGGGTLDFYNSNRPDMKCRMSWEYARAYMNDAMWIEPIEN
ncbi:MAG: C25 family cysteine peptidase [Verrucomicrobiota bacterium]